MAEITSEYVAVEETGMGRRICWSAIFSGTMVALATELLFATFGLFIGFTMSGGGGGGISAWSEAWYFVTAFVALFLGAWVAARSADNTAGSGHMHGAVTWGLTTISTLAFAIWLFGSALNAAVLAVRPAVAAAATSPQAAGMTAGEASTLFLVIFGGIVAGYVASWLGGVLGDRRHGPPEVSRLRHFGRTAAPSTRPAVS